MANVERQVNQAAGRESAIGDATFAAAEDDLGRWLARRWGALADVDPELLEQIAL